MRALASAELPVLDQVTKSLSETLVRDGETFSAAAASLELLEPLVSAPAAGGHRASWVLGEVFAAGHLGRLSGQPSKASAERDAVPARAGSARSTLLSALASEDAAWRSGAAFALSFVPGVDAESLAVAARRESEPRVRASLLWALGVRSREDDVARRVLSGSLVGGGHAGEPALARALAGEGVGDAELTRTILAFCLAPPARELIPWGGLGGATRFVEAIVASEAHRRKVAPRLGEALASPPRVRTDPRRPQLAALVLAWAGHGEAYPPRHVARVEALTPDLRRIAEAFATDDSLGVARTGLAGGARALRRWLGELPPGPPEGLGPDGEPRWVTARALLGAGKPFAEVLATLMEGLTGRARLDALTELLRGAYRMTWDAQGRLPPSGSPRRQLGRGRTPSRGRETSSTKSSVCPWGFGTLTRCRASGRVTAWWRSQFPSGPESRSRRASSVRSPWVTPPLERSWGALPVDSVRRATLERWRTQGSINPAARGAFIQEVLPLFDDVGSAELAQEMPANLGGAGAKPPPGLAPGVIETLSRLGAGG